MEEAFPGYTCCRVPRYIVGTLYQLRKEFFIAFWLALFEAARIKAYPY